MEGLGQTVVNHVLLIIKASVVYDLWLIIKADGRTVVYDMWTIIKALGWTVVYDV